MTKTKASETSEISISNPVKEYYVTVNVLIVTTCDPIKLDMYISSEDPDVFNIISTKIKSATQEVNKESFFNLSGFNAKGDRTSISLAPELMKMSIFSVINGKDI